MKEPTQLSAWSWRLISAVPMYLGLTLAVASLAAPPENPADPFGAPVQRMGSSLAEFLPGTSIWPHLMDMHGKVAGTFPTTLVVLIVFVLLGAGAITMGRNISAQFKKDAGTARDEVIRERVRQQSRRK